MVGEVSRNRLIVKVKQMKLIRTWILVADAGRARAISIEGNPAKASPHDEFEVLHLHKRAGEIQADRPGRSFASADSRRSAMEPPSDPVEVESNRFAKDILEQISTRFEETPFDRLIIVAPPKMLGNLRKSYPDALRNVLAGELDSDLTQHTDKDVLDLLKRKELL